MEALQNFEDWKSFLSRNVKVAQAAGTSQEAIVGAATRIGDFLSKNVDSENREQRVLAELWRVADQQEKHSIASCITKMVSDGVRH